jgi:hypothetical protein
MNVTLVLRIAGGDRKHIPGLRAMPRPVPLDSFAFGLVAGALGITTLGEEIWSRRTMRNKRQPLTDRDRRTT